MNAIERFVYDIVKTSPRLRKLVRNAYQSIFDILPTPKYKSAYPIIQRKGYFFGFHDHSPFSHDNKRLLANHFNDDLYMPNGNNALEIGFFEGDDYEHFIPVSQSYAWNWHMGCKLQWRGSYNEIIFNDYREGSNISRIINIDSKEEIILPDSISSVSPDGKWAVGYSFKRLNKLMPGYGYLNDVIENDIDIKKPNSGIYRINLDDNTKKNIISIEKLASINQKKTMNKADHFLTHAIFSPDSSKFIFLHRWVNLDGDIEKRFSRLVVANIEGDILNIFKTDEMVSHIGWKSSSEVVAYCRLNVFGDKYAIFNVRDDDHFKVLGKDQLLSDGHPSFESSGRWMITDTYPNRRRVQQLIIYDTHSNQRFDIAHLPMPKKFQSPTIYKHWACDLHPRWRKDSQMISFDSTFSGSRSLCTINLEEDLKNNKLSYLLKS